MLLKEISRILNARVLVGEQLLETEIDSACGSDLMSDVLAFVKDHAMLLTGLINPQVVRTAEMMDIKVIAFVRGKFPSEEMINLARDKGMLLMSTDYPLYIACGRLYKGGLVGKDCGVQDE